MSQSFLSILQCSLSLIVFSQSLQQWMLVGIHLLPVMLPMIHLRERKLNRLRTQPITFTRDNMWSASVSSPAAPTNNILRALTCIIVIFESTPEVQIGDSREAMCILRREKENLDMSKVHHTKCGSCKTCRQLLILSRMPPIGEARILKERSNVEEPRRSCCCDNHVPKD